MSETTTYIVKEGERWDTIANKAYGRASLFHVIVLANPTVPVTTRIAGGTVLKIPVIEDNTAKTDKELLPPWKTTTTDSTGNTSVTGLTSSDVITVRGIDGSVWRNGIGAPKAGLGKDNDYYLDTFAGDIYKKSSDAYSIVGNIKGTRGSAGPAGPVGSGAGSSYTEASEDFTGSSDPTITLAHTPAAGTKVVLYKNGYRLKSSAYSVVGTTITLTDARVIDDEFTADYKY